MLLFSYCYQHVNDNQLLTKYSWLLNMLDNIIYQILFLSRPKSISNTVNYAVIKYDNTRRLLDSIKVSA